MPLLVELSSGRNHWVGNYGPLLTLLWTRSLEPSVYQRLIEYAKKVAAKQDSGCISVISIALAGAHSPSSEGRRALVSLLRETDSYVSRVAIVREGQGFVASTVVSVMSGLQMLAKPNACQKFFPDVRDAVIWASAELPDFRTGKIGVEDAISVVEKQRKIQTNRLIEVSV